MLGARRAEHAVTAVVSQDAKGRSFRELHTREDAFIIPNPWDAGSARLLARLGFEALASSSAGYAFSLGKCDNTVGREAMLEHVAEIVRATDLPVSADLENGFGDSPRVVAETIHLAGDTGLIGGSIEDSTTRADDPIYEHSLAVERVQAAAESARTLPYPFTLTARCENYLVGRPDLGATIKRLQAYQSAGADVLYAPGLSELKDIATLVAEVDRPVNVLMGLAGVGITRADLSAVGVKRVSVGSALARAAYGALLKAAREMGEHGSFSFADEAVSFKELSAMFGD